MTMLNGDRAAHFSGATTNPSIVCVIGTRPEAIKMAPVVMALRARGISAPILATAQHRELLDQVLSVFGLQTEWDLDAMRPDQSPSELLAWILPKIEEILRSSRPDAILVQGDTTTVLSAAIAAYHAGIPVGHVEAGLRSGNLQSPFPEEGNRRITTVLSRWHFAPTQASSEALEREGVSSRTIHLVGNTGIDALLGTAVRPDLPWPTGVPRPRDGERLGLITVHRRENFGPALERILTAVKAFALGWPEDRFLYPVHPNPKVQEVAQRLLSGISNLELLEPLDYPTFVNVLRSSHAVFTDSGGLQEEGPALGIPALVFREVTERPEAVEAGSAILVGSDPGAFLREANRLWEDKAHHGSMAVPRFPFGDGHAATRIADILSLHFAHREAP